MATVLVIVALGETEVAGGAVADAPVVGAERADDIATDVLSVSLPATPTVLSAHPATPSRIAAAAHTIAP
jgi:hypothetical protein